MATKNNTTIIHSLKSHPVPVEEDIHLSLLIESFWFVEYQSPQSIVLLGWFWLLLSGNYFCFFTHNTGCLQGASVGGKKDAVLRKMGPTTGESV